MKVNQENAQQLQLELEHESNTVRRQKLLKQIWKLTKEHHGDSGPQASTTKPNREAKALKKLGNPPSLDVVS